MFKALYLLDKTYMSQYLARKLAHLGYHKLDWPTLEVYPIKQTIGSKYHLVICYKVKSLDRQIFCTAHSKEDRKSAYLTLKYLISQKFFTKDNFHLEPLSYSPGFKAFFYLGVDGDNLQGYIRRQPEKVKNVLKFTAQWLALLHPSNGEMKKHNFNPRSSQIETQTPGSAVFLRQIREKQPKYSDEMREIFNLLNDFDKTNLAENQKWLIHGDMHPENVIVNHQDESVLTVIDYTDICVADFARDLGNFLHQLDYMVKRFNPTLAKQLPELKKYFLDEYLKARKIDLTEDLKKRINMYLAWTAYRNAVFFLTKSFVETTEADKSLESVHKYLEAANLNLKSRNRP